MGIEYRLSNGGIWFPNTDSHEPLRSGVLVEHNLRRKLEPTIGEKLMKAASLLTVPLAAIAGITYSAAAWANNQQVNVEKPRPAHEVLIGTAVSGTHDRPNKNVTGNLDSWLVYDGRQGERLILQSNNDILGRDNHSIAYGMSSGQVIDNLMQLRLVTESTDLNDFAYTLMSEAFLFPKLTARTGVMQTRSAIGGFVGGSYKINFLTVDGDVWNLNEIPYTAGHLAGIIPINNLEVYAGLGGNTSTEVVNIIAGLITEGQFGLFTRTTLDYRNIVSSGEIRLAPTRSTMDRDLFDFQGHLYAGTEMTTAATGHLFDTFPPPDGKSVQPGGILFVLTWDKGVDEEGSRLTMHYRPLENFIVAAGPSVRYDSAKFRQWLKEIEGVKDPKPRDFHRIGYSAEVFFKEPSTGLFGLAHVDHDITGRKVSPLVFLGWNGSF